MTVKILIIYEKVNYALQCKTNLNYHLIISYVC